ncbi:MAG: tetratricopeptide repeat protein [Bacteroidales bacterium]
MKKIFYLIFTLLLISSCVKDKAEYYRFITNDSKRFLIGRCPVDKDIVPKVGCYHFTYNSDGRAVKIEYLNRGKSGYDENFDVSKIKISYENGIERRIFLGINNDTISNKDYVCQEIIERDSNFYPKSTKFANKYGNPIFNKSGIYCYKYKIDEKGRIIESIRLDSNMRNIADDKKILNIKRTYDKNDNIIANTNIIQNLNDSDVVFINYKYDSYGNIVLKKQYNKNHKPIPLTENIYSVERKYDKNGNSLEEINYDKNDKLTENKNGFCMFKFKYNKYWSQIEVSCYNKNKELSNSKDGISIIKLDYNSDNYIIAESYYDKNKNNTTNDKKVFMYKYTLDSIGYLKNELYYNIDEKEITKTPELITEHAKNRSKIKCDEAFRLSNEKTNYQMALSLYNDAINLNPFIAETYNKRGKLYESNGNIENALNDYKKSLEYDPKLAESYSNIGIIYYNKKDYQNALNYFNESINNNKDNAYPYYYRSLIKYDLKDHIGSINELKKLLFDNVTKFGKDDLLLFRDVTNPIAFLNSINFYLGLNYYEIKDYNNSIKYYSDALRFKNSNSIDAAIYYNRALCYVKLNSKKACDDFRKAGELGNVDAFKMLNSYCK